MSFPLKLKIKFPGGSAGGSVGNSNSSHQPGKKRKRPEDGRAGPAPPGVAPGRIPDQPAEAPPKRIKLKSNLTAGSGQQHGAERPPKPKLKLKGSFASLGLAAAPPGYQQTAPLQRRPAPPGLEARAPTQPGLPSEKRKQYWLDKPVTTKLPYKSGRPPGGVFKRKGQLPGQLAGAALQTAQPRTPRSEAAAQIQTHRPPSKGTAAEDDISQGASRPGVGPPSTPSGPPVIAERVVVTTEAKPDAPEAPTTSMAVKWAIDRVQKKDMYEMFRHPVTEAVAPGYFAVVRSPMDFTTMRARLEARQYTSWDELQSDMETMFNNAMVYNPSRNRVHKQARNLLAWARKTLEMARSGRQDARRKAALAALVDPNLPAATAAANTAAALPGAAAAAMPAAAGLPDGVAARRDATVQPQQLGATLRPKQPMQYAPIRKAKAGRGNKAKRKWTRRTTTSSSASQLEVLLGGEMDIDENVRASFQPLTPEPIARAWKALARGASAEGLPYAATRFVTPPIGAGALTAEAYARSVMRFAARLSGAAKEAALKRAAEASEMVRIPSPAPAPAPLAAALNTLPPQQRATPLPALGQTPSGLLPAGSAASWRPPMVGMQNPAPGQGLQALAAMRPSYAQQTPAYLAPIGSIVPRKGNVAGGVSTAPAPGGLNFGRGAAQLLAASQRLVPPTTGRAVAPTPAVQPAAFQQNPNQPNGLPFARGAPPAIASALQAQARQAQQAQRKP